MESKDMPARSSAARGPRTLAELQNLSKRDPETYRADFVQQWRHFESNLQIFLLKPTDDAKEFCELIMFVAHLSGCYRDVVEPFPRQVIGLLSQHHAVLDSEVRHTLCRALILLRSKELVSSIECLEIFFQLFRCPDKALREMLFKHIVKDVRQMNLKHKQNKLNKTLQNFMYGMLSDPNQTAAKKSLDVMVALYRKRVWQDAKTVNVVSTALFSDVGKIKTAALRFFLGGDQEEDDDEGDDDDDHGKTYQDMLHNKTAKKTVKRQKLLKKALAKEKKKERAAQRPEVYNASALHMVHDPQGLAERMFKGLRSSKDRWEVQLMTMNLISRLISVHELLVLNFYPYLERYLWPSKQDVTQVLAYVAQACHEHVPPEALESVLMKIANNFVSERSAPEVMAVGINAIREISRRCPLAMTEPLLRDLAQYKKYKNKAVMTAARGLIGTFRELNPELLHKKDRGRPDEDALDDGAPLEYGELRAAEFAPGVELLTMDEERRLLDRVLAAERESGGVAGGAGAAAEAEGSEDSEVSEGDDRDEGEGEEGDEVDVEGDDDDDDDDEEEEEYDDDEGGGWVSEDNDGAAAATAPAVRAGGRVGDDDDAWSEGSGGWVTVDHGPDDAADSEPAGPVVKDELTAEERRRRAIERMNARPLTQEDFDRIRVLQLERRLMPSSKAKRARAADETHEQYVDADAIMPVMKKGRQTKEERLQSVLEGREGRGKFNIRKGHDGGTTNRQKEHRKNPMMIKHKRSARARALESVMSKVAKARTAKKQFRGKKGKGRRK